MARQWISQDRISSAGALSPDETRIATGGTDGTVRFFEYQVCQPAGALLTLARTRVSRELTPTERDRFLRD